MPREFYEFETSLIDAKAGALIVSFAQKQEDGSVVTSLAQLKGKWQANAKNEIQFLVEGQSGKKKALTFTGSWSIGENNEIIYEYGSRQNLQTLTFKGYWDILDGKRLTYLIEGNSKSAFRFRGAFQTQSILAKEGELRYQIGVEAGRKLRRKSFVKTIVLFGKWKLSDKFGLSFEIEYENGAREIRFGAEYSLSPASEITAGLISPEGKPLGIEVVFTQTFPKTQAQAFLKLRKSLQENAIEGGIVIPW